jgi:hypothetical protein
VKRGIILVFVLAALTACGGKKDESKQTGGSGSAQAAGSATGSAAAGSAQAAGSAAGSAKAAPDEVDAPTEVDFETEAAAKINEKNVETQLKAIEKDLSQ